MDYQLTIHTPTDTATRTLTAEPDGLTQAVHGHVRGLLGSSRVTVQLDPDTLTGEITSHRAHAGRFALEPLPEQPTPDAADEGGVKWGYTHADLQRYARAAAMNARFFNHAAWHDYYEEALSAIFMYLVAADGKPHRGELLHAADNAITDLVRGRRRDRGWREATADDGIKQHPKFFRYWTPGAPADLAERTTERIAVHQILDALRPGDRAAVEALADYGDYGTAAEALGITGVCLRQRLHRARQQFLRLWHYPETPGPRWRQDRRRSTNPAKEICGNGHDYSNLENVGYRTAGVRRGERYCKACSREWSADRRAARQQVAA